MTDSPPAPRFQTERQREILGLTLRAGRVEVAELADRFGVTTETIRRDLSDLQRQRALRRVHGGAIPWPTNGFEPLLSVRTELHEAEKRRIAHAAVLELPADGEILVDSGSTLSTFAEVFPSDLKLRVATNSLPTAQCLAEHDGVDVIVIGGRLRTNTMALVDSDAVETVKGLTVDTAFVSSDGFSPERGLTTPYRQEASLKRAMIGAARRVVALVDHSKAGNDHFARFAQWRDIDVLITNGEVEDSMVAAIEAHGTTVVQT